MMKYNFSEIKESKNYIKVGNTEEIVNEITDEEAIEIRSRLKKVIEPWLSAALQSEHLSLLIGAGLTTAVCQIAKVSSSSMGTANFGDDFSEKVDKYAKKAAEEMGRGNPNIEDQIRTATALLRGYEIDEKEDEAKKLGDKLDDVLSDFANSILSSEANLFKELVQGKSSAIKASAVLQSFLFTFASRNSTRERTHIFTTNYDRFLEYGCDMAGIKILDRFWGKIIPRFQESPSNLDYYYHASDSKNEFRYAEGVVRYTKIHGSIDWYENNGIVYRDALRFGANEVSLPSGTTYRDHLMIYPNSMKSVETAFYPYAELFRDFSSAIVKPNSTLFVYGYGFGDTHINKIIKEMMSVPSTHIVVIAYNVDDRLVNFLSKINMAQVTLLTGSEFANLENLVEYYLPKAAIDIITETASRLVDSRKGYLDLQNNEEAANE